MNSNPRRLVAMIAALPLLTSLTGCGKPDPTVEGIKYARYGLLNEGDKRNPDIEYEVNLAHVILGALLVETVIAPIYFFGFDLYRPVGKRGGIKGQILQ